jgi:hypothetical protein
MVLLPGVMEQFSRLVIATKLVQKSPGVVLLLPRVVLLLPGVMEQLLGVVLVLPGMVK